MKYLAKSFTVPASSEKSPPDCQHGWVAKGRCVLCGEHVFDLGALAQTTDSYFAPVFVPVAPPDFEFSLAYVES